MAYAAADPPETSFAILTSVVWSGRHNEGEKVLALTMSVMSKNIA